MVDWNVLIEIFVEYQVLAGKTADALNIFQENRVLPSGRLHTHVDDYLFFFLHPSILKYPVVNYIHNSARFVSKCHHKLHDFHAYRVCFTLQSSIVSDSSSFFPYAPARI